MAKRPNKTVEERRRRVSVILPILKATYPGAKCSLDYRTPLQLLVATILSAQCTDVRVNLVTKSLFNKYKTPRDFAEAPEGVLEKEIQSTGFFRSKAKSLRAMASSLLKEFGGKVPQTMEELTSLAGVGRKTANVVLGNAFGKNVGVVVDTHVARLSQRLGMTRNTDPVKIEADLMQIVPQDEWTLWSHLLIHHGRAICQARTLSDPGPMPDRAGRDRRARRKNLVSGQFRDGGLKKMLENLREPSSRKRPCDPIMHFGMGKLGDAMPAEARRSNGGIVERRRHLIRKLSLRIGAAGFGEILHVAKLLDIGMCRLQQMAESLAVSRRMKRVGNRRIQQVAHDRGVVAVRPERLRFIQAH